MLWPSLLHLVHAKSFPTAGQVWVHVLQICTGYKAAKSAVFECGRQQTLKHLVVINFFDVCLSQQFQKIFCLVCLASLYLVNKLKLPEINMLNGDCVCRPYVRSKGRKFERARGRRASRGYKN